jgi:hypothetical protein
MIDDWCLTRGRGSLGGVSEVRAEIEGSEGDWWDGCEAG